jgi:hypothetical protein
VAALGGLEALLGGLEANTKKTMTEVLRALVPYLRFGPVDTPKAENFAAYKVTSVTGTSTGEFSVEHGIGRTPYLLVPMLDVTAVGAAMVPLEVTRSADDRRIYLKTQAGSTNLPFSVYLEG